MKEEHFCFFTLQRKLKSNRNRDWTIFRRYLLSICRNFPQTQPQVQKSVIIVRDCKISLHQNHFNMSRIHIILFFLTFPFSPIFSQKNKVAPADFALAEKMKIEYEDAGVIATDSKIDITFNFNSKTNKVEVLVTKDEEFLSLKPGHAHTAFDFFNEQSEIKSTEAFNEKGKKLYVNRREEVTASNGIFYSDAQVSYFNVEFPTIGSRRRIKTAKTYFDVRYFVSEYLSDTYPILKREIVYHIPAWLQAEFKTMNFTDVVENTSTDAKTGDKLFSYKMKDIAPQVQESAAKGPSHLYPHILFLYQGYDYKGEKNAGFRETKDLYSWYRSLIKGMNNNQAEVASLAKKLTTDAMTDIEKIKAIYYWVQENIRYIAFEDGIAGFRPDNCQSVYEKKYGDCKGMANLTKEMLLSVGMDARLVWIGTRRLAYDYSTPSLGVDNHMICAVKYEDDFIFLDATEEFNEFGEYAERIQGRQVMIEDGENFIAKTIPVAKYSDNTKLLRRKFTLEDEKLTGTSSYQMNGDSKAYFLYQINNLKQDKRDLALKSFLSDDDKSVQVDNVETTNLEKRDGTIKIDFDFSWEKGISAFGEEVYVDLDFDKEFKNWKFDERKTDYLFDHKMHRISEVELAIPTGHQVTYLPKAFERKHEDFFFKIDYAEKDGRIFYRKEIAIPNSEIKKKDFDIWNGFVKDLTKQYKEQIVLKKG